MKYPIIIIPHPAYEYGGFARKKAFLSMKKKERNQIDKIIYISAYHGNMNEHSYLWVKDELYEYFPNAKHYVYQPKSWRDSEKMVKMIPIDEKMLLIGTTDLIHYGKKFNNEGKNNVKKMNQSQRRKWKKNKEKKIINSLVKYKSEIMKNIYLSDKNIMCGPYSIYLILKYIEKNFPKKKGKIVSYYDSLEKRYIKINNLKNNNNFVSYISIIYD